MTERPSAEELLHLLPLTQGEEGGAELQISSWTQFKAQRRQVLSLEEEVARLKDQVRGLLEENQHLKDSLHVCEDNPIPAAQTIN